MVVRRTALAVRGAVPKEEEPARAPAGMEARLRIGCSSWTSPAWWGRVYPPGIAEGERLGCYAGMYDTVEVDSTYYGGLSAALARRWAKVTPPDFVFSLKIPRDLFDPRTPPDPGRLEGFTGPAALLGPKEGPLLVQFPPGFRPGRGERFLASLLGALPPGPRYAVELRHADWFRGETWARLERSLRDRGMALAWSYLTYVAVPRVRTADFVYLRFIGDHTTIPESEHGETRVDRSPILREYVPALLEARTSVREIFVYFNNHFAGFAPASVNLFRAIMHLPPIDLARSVRVPGEQRQQRLPGL